MSTPMPSPTEANVESLIHQQANLLQTVIKVEEETTTTTTTNNDEKMVVTKMEVTSDEPLSWLKDEPIAAVTTSAMPELTGDIEEDDDEEDIAPVGRTISEDEGEDAKDDKPRRKRISSSFAISADDYLDSDDGLLDSDLDSDGGEEDDDLETATARGRYTEQDLEEQHENESAAASGLPYSLMSPLELEYMPEFASYSHIYVQIRNLICRQWHRSLHTFLTFDQFLHRSNLDASKLRHSARRIFDFLNLHGFINCGLLPIARDSDKRRPIEQQSKLESSASATAEVTHQPMVRRKSEEQQDQQESKTDEAGDVVMKDTTNGDSSNTTISSPPSSIPSAPASASSHSKRILIIGAGASGLAAARQLQSFGHEVIVLEGRSRIGGRVHTIRDKFSAPVDLGASIMTGLYGSPLNVLSKQMFPGNAQVGFSTMKVIGKSTVEAPNKPFPTLMHYIHHHCPLYDSNGSIVDPATDTKMEELWNKLLEAEYAFKVNAGHACEMPADIRLTRTEMDKLRLPNSQDLYTLDVDSGISLTRKLLGVRVTPLEEKLLDWHAANLEYGCATPLKRLSLVYWDQDDAMAWEGDHALIKPGFGSFIDHLSTDVDIRLNQHVQSIVYPPEEQSTNNNATTNTTDPLTASTSSSSASTSSPSLSPSSSSSSGPIRVRTKDNLTGATTEYHADYLVCTASLGVLKSGAMDFQPPLPDWKSSAIKGLGFGLLNKLILEFPHAFWKTKNDFDMFGYITPGPSADRGKFYIFWNLERSTGRPILATLCAGEAAYSSEGAAETDLVRDCMTALRAIHKEQLVPEPIVAHQTKWSQDPYACGTYSYVAAGNNGREYDLLAKPVGTSLYFAGEACCRDYPATVPGAYISGLRAAGVLQSSILDWRRAQSPSSEVMRELANQQMTSTRTRSDAHASTLTNQAVQELERAGGRGDTQALQKKIAEIMARQRKRKGFRYEYTQQEPADEEKMQYDENLASKLAAAARLLKAGLFTPHREPVTKPTTVNSRFAHVKHFDGAFERPFDALTHDTQGLPEFVGFNEFDLNTFGPTPIAVGVSDDNKSRTKSRRELRRHEKKRRAAAERQRSASKKHKSEKKSKGSSSSSSSSATPEVLIHRHVGKVAVRCAAASYPSARENMKLLKQVQRKAGAKVLEDWQSKPRGSLAVAEWMNDKRKKKIEELVQKYLEIFTKSSSPSASAPSQPVTSSQ